MLRAPSIALLCIVLFLIAACDQRASVCHRCAEGIDQDHQVDQQLWGTWRAVGGGRAMPYLVRDLCLVFTPGNQYVRSCYVETPGSGIRPGHASCGVGSYAVLGEGQLRMDEYQYQYTITVSEADSIDGHTPALVLELRAEDQLMYRCIKAE